MTIPFYYQLNQKLGRLDDKIFALFWQKKSKECIELLESLIRELGSPEFLSTNNILIYKYCSKQLGIKTNITDYIAEKINLEQVKLMGIFEENIESLDKNNDGKNILSQPNWLNKAIKAANIGIKNNCSTVIETGTFLGVSTYIFSGVFNEVITIEADEKLHEVAKEWLVEKTDNITCLRGNSGELLSKSIENRVEKILIFLDAHYSTGITSKEYGICPLIEELNAIYESSNAECITVIDDIRCMGMEGYPTISEIIERIPNGKAITIEHDQMIIL